MATMAMQSEAGGGYVQRSKSSGLYEILDVLLDRAQRMLTIVAALS